jgi:hypothetical protein
MVSGMALRPEVAVRAPVAVPWMTLPQFVAEQGWIF